VTALARTPDANKGLDLSAIRQKERREKDIQKTAEAAASRREALEGRIFEVARKACLMAKPLRRAPEVRLPHPVLHGRQRARRDGLRRAPDPWGMGPM
jgi:hypothetical protein